MKATLLTSQKVATNFSSSSCIDFHSLLSLKMRNSRKQRSALTTPASPGGEPEMNSGGDAMSSAVEKHTMSPSSALDGSVQYLFS